jgi:hypothetical protein
VEEILNVMREIQELSTEHTALNVPITTEQVVTTPPTHLINSQDLNQLLGMLQ